MVYRPTQPSVNDLDGLQNWLAFELDRIAHEFSETTALELRPINAAPKRPREGMIVCADGTNWNPGSGAGAYEYKGGAWVKL